jgi:Flp pilus assembly protein TadG
MRNVPLRGRGRRDAGTMTLSYVIIVPVFLAALMVIVQASMWYLARQAALAAARQGADAARALHAPAGAGPRAALQFAHSAASGYLENPQASPQGSTATTVQITVTGQIPALVPGVVIHVSQVAQAPVEQFTTP